MSKLDQLFLEEGLLTLLIKEFPAAIAILDKEMRYLAYSDRWLQDYVIQEESIVGDSHYKYFPNLEPEWIEQHQLALQGKIIEADEQSFIRLDGSEVWTKRKYLPLRHSTGEINGIIILNEVTTDKIRLQKLSTELQKSNDQLIYSENFKDLILENNPDFIFVKDSDFRIVLANQNFINMYPEEKRNKIIGYTTLEDYQPAEADAFLAMDKQAFAEGSSEVLESIVFPDRIRRILQTKKIRFDGPDKQ
ncbi:MAG: PAS domain-containing protein, partial [Pseudomonadota bacterium]